MSVGSDDDGFDAIDADEIRAALAAEDARLTECPWARPDHPLYFPTPNDDPVRRQALLRAASAEATARLFGQHTFHTSSIVLTRADVAVLLQGWDGVDDSSTERAALISRVHSAIEAHVAAAHGEVTDGVFVRMTTRSPKDVPYLCEPWRTRLRDAFQRRRAASKDAMSPDAKLVALLSEARALLRVRTGAEAVHLLASSPALRLDLSSAIAAADGSKNNSQCEPCIVLRSWEAFDITSELRVFVSRLTDPDEPSAGGGGEASGGLASGVDRLSRVAWPSRGDPVRVTAISPWFHFLNYATLRHDGLAQTVLGNEELICEALDRFVSEVVERRLREANTADPDADVLSASSYVLDVCIAPLDNAGAIPDDLAVVRVRNGPVETPHRIRIVEINGFHPAVTAAKMFDWKRDAGTLCFGRRPTLRLRTHDDQADLAQRLTGVTAFPRDEVVTLLRDP